jgi:hypothetical protein
MVTAMENSNAELQKDTTRFKTPPVSANSVGGKLRPAPSSSSNGGHEGNGLSFQALKEQEVDQLRAFYKDKHEQIFRALCTKQQELVKRMYVDFEGRVQRERSRANELEEKLADITSGFVKRDSNTTGITSSVNNKPISVDRNSIAQPTAGGVGGKASTFMSRPSSASATQRRPVQPSHIATHHLPPSSYNHPHSPTTLATPTNDPTHLRAVNPNRGKSSHDRNPVTAMQGLSGSSLPTDHGANRYHSEDEAFSGRHNHQR